MPRWVICVPILRSGEAHPRKDWYTDFTERHRLNPPINRSIDNVKARSVASQNRSHPEAPGCRALARFIRPVWGRTLIRGRVCHPFKVQWVSAIETCAACANFKRESHRFRVWAAMTERVAVVVVWAAGGVASHELGHRNSLITHRLPTFAACRERSQENCGTDGHCGPPPAQIRGCGTTAFGFYLGW